ncbi:hypothetical protein [Chryseobacterium kwangjuense]|uniref:hypothetical protein n=1 Tax=Chryseobacterium kwangjuense TaxID=267125 RepID=UPI0010420481|nr:hypothetical protein [Chryseobacterium kwangjuense]
MKQFLKELNALLWIITGIVIFSLIITILNKGNNRNIFFASFLIYIFLVIFFYALQRILKNTIAKNIFAIIMFPFSYISKLMGFIFFSTTICVHIIIYLGICLVIQKSISFTLEIIDKDGQISFDNHKYLEITITALLAVFLNTPIRFLINKGILLKNIFQNLKYDQIENAIEFVFNKQNIKLIIYFSYTILIAYTTFISFQNETRLIFHLKSEIIIKSFVTFIAFDKVSDLVIKLDFRPSKLVDIFKKHFE